MVITYKAYSKLEVTECPLVIYGSMVGVFATGFEKVNTIIAAVLIRVCEAMIDSCKEILKEQIPFLYEDQLHFGNILS
jgi:hypothetical protein